MLFNPFYKYYFYWSHVFFILNYSSIIRNLASFQFLTSFFIQHTSTPFIHPLNAMNFTLNKVWISKNEIHLWRRKALRIKGYSFYTKQCQDYWETYEAQMCLPCGGYYYLDPYILMCFFQKYKPDSLLMYIFRQVSLMYLKIT